MVTSFYVKRYGFLHRNAWFAPIIYCRFVDSTPCWIQLLLPLPNLQAPLLVLPLPPTLLLMSLQPLPPLPNHNTPLLHLPLPPTPLPMLQLPLPNLQVPSLMLPLTVTSATAKSSCTIAGASSASHTVINIAAATTVASFGSVVVESPTCDWAAEKCSLIGLPQIKSQRSGCNNMHTMSPLLTGSLAIICQKWGIQHFVVSTMNNIIPPSSGLLLLLLQPLLLSTANAMPEEERHSRRRTETVNAPLEVEMRH